MAKKPTTKTPFSHLDDLDMMAPSADNPLTVPSKDDKENDDSSDIADKLNVARGRDTKAAVSNINPNDAMRNAMSRLRDIEGIEGEVLDPDDVDDDVGIDVTPVNVENLPAVVSRAVQIPGQEINWHRVRNLPGYRQMAIRSMGKSEFDNYTRTPQGDIVTIAYFKPPGDAQIDVNSTQAAPNTPSEVLNVVKWLQSNAKDLGEPNLPSARFPIRGYEAKIRHFTANGVRFQVMMDSIDGETIAYYVYAWPEQDSKFTGSDETVLAAPPTTKQLREGSTEVFDAQSFKKLLNETAKHEYRYEKLIKKLVLEYYKNDDEPLVEWTKKQREKRNASLTRLLGDEPGAIHLIRFMHKTHKLSDEARYVPALEKGENGKERIMWQKFKSDPDNFQFIVADRGVAGIKPFEKDIAAGRTGNNLRYQVIAANADGFIKSDLIRPVSKSGDPDRDPTDPTVMIGRGGLPKNQDVRNMHNIFDRLREMMGNLNEFYHTYGGVEREKIATRQRSKQEKELDFNEAKRMVAERIRPILKKLTNKLYNEVRLDINQSSGNMDEIKKLSDIGSKIEKFRTAINTSGALDVSSEYSGNPFSKTFINALRRAASELNVPATEFANDIALKSPGSMQYLEALLHEIRKDLLSVAR